MAKRSLYASSEGAKLARKIFDRRGWTQENLAAELDLKTRQPIWRFFTCRPIERHIFIEICTILDLNWWEIAAQVPEHLLSSEDEGMEPSGSNQLVEQIRLKHRERIEYLCRTVRIPGTNAPIQLSEIYVEPRFLCRLPSQKYVDIAQLEKSYTQTLSSLKEQRFTDFIIQPNSILENHSQLRILGKPGGGKTAFLKWLALQCIHSHFRPDLVPVFIQLRNYSVPSAKQGEFTLLHCIQQELTGCSISNPQDIETMLAEGKFLLLLDELDEISCCEQYAVIVQEICRFSQLYYKNRVILNSRLSNQDSEIPHFSDFELLDFDDEQVALLVKKWFELFNQSMTLSSQVSPIPATEYFLQQLNSPINSRIRELGGNPLLLDRICRIFHETNELFDNRIKIYEECLTLYLAKSSKVSSLQLAHSELQLNYFEQLYILGRLALFALQKGRYFLEQAELEELIEVGVCELQKGIDHRMTLREEIVSQLKSSFLQQGVLVEQSRGVFSFCNLAFQEYLAAKQIALSLNSKQDLSDLLSHLIHPAWREVCIISSSKLKDRSLLLNHIKLEAQALVSSNPDIKVMLDELQKKSGKWLVYQQIAEVHRLFFHIARSPERLLHLARAMTYVSILAQRLLLEIILAKLIFWLAVPNWRDDQVSGVIQPLLEQALGLVTHYQYQKLTNCLTDISGQIFQGHWASVSPSKQWEHRSRWLEHLAKSVNEVSDIPSLRLDVEQMRALQLYFYSLQLLTDCQDKEDTDHCESLLIQLSDVPFCLNSEELFPTSNFWAPEFLRPDQLNSTHEEVLSSYSVLLHPRSSLAPS